MDDEVDAEQLGVTTALERTVELDSRLRQAIHDTHMVSSDFGTSPDTEEAEREALLAVNDQLEQLERKLRAYSRLGPHEYDDKTTLLSQLDELRRDLITVSYESLEAVHIAKEIVRDVRDFAEMRADDGYSNGSSASYSDSDSDGPGSSTAGSDEGGQCTSLARGVEDETSPELLPQDSLEHAIARASATVEEHVRQSSPTHSGKSEQQGDSDRASGPDTPPKGLPQAAAAQRRLDSAGAPDFSGDSSTTTWDEATSPAAAGGTVGAAWSPGPRPGTAADGILGGHSGQAAADRLDLWRPRTAASSDDDENAAHHSSTHPSPTLAQSPPPPKHQHQHQHRHQHRRELQQEEQPPESLRQHRRERLRSDGLSRRYPGTPAEERAGSGDGSPQNPRLLPPLTVSSSGRNGATSHSSRDGDSSGSEGYGTPTPPSAASGRSVISQQLAAQRARYKPRASPGAKTATDPQYGGTVAARPPTAAGAASPDLNRVGQAESAPVAASQRNGHQRNRFDRNSLAARAAPAPALDRGNKGADVGAPRARRRRRLPLALAAATISAIAGAGVAAVLSAQQERKPSPRRWKPKHLSTCSHDSNWLRPAPPCAGRQESLMAIPGEGFHANLGRG